jgi:hypothetical protein
LDLYFYGENYTARTGISSTDPFEEARQTSGLTAMFLGMAKGI